MLNTLPVLAVSRARSSEIFTFFLWTHYRQMAWGSVLTWIDGPAQILLTCFASSLFCIHPFHPFLSRSSFWRFSLSTRLVTASQRLLFRWKYRRRSSFFAYTPKNGWKNVNSPNGISIVERKFLFEWSEFLRTKTLGNMYSFVSSVMEEQVIHFPCSMHLLI